MKFSVRTMIAITFAALLLTACANNTPTASLPKDVPALKVVTDCGDCQVRPEVLAIIEQGYTAAAVKAGVAVVKTREATLTIKSYNDRGYGIRAVAFLIGPLGFALKDEIKANLSVNGKELPVEDNYRNPFSGMDTLAEKIGGMTFDAVIK